jgi:hypothetical protein
MFMVSTGLADISLPFLASPPPEVGETAGMTADYEARRHPEYE